MQPLFLFQANGNSHGAAGMFYEIQNGHPKGCYGTLQATGT